MGQMVWEQDPVSRKIKGTRSQKQTVPSARDRGGQGVEFQSQTKSPER